MIDKTDRRLLRLLQQNNQRTLRDLAEAIAVSPATCLRRVRGLRERDVIRADVSVLNATALGFGLSAYIEVSLERTGGAALAAFERRMCALPHVQRCAELSGDVDYLLYVLLTSMADLSAFTRQHLGTGRNVRSFRTLVVMRSPKDEITVPV